MMYSIHPEIALAMARVEMRTRVCEAEQDALARRHRQGRPSLAQRLALAASDVLISAGLKLQQRHGQRIADCALDRPTEFALTR